MTNLEFTLSKCFIVQGFCDTETVHNKETSGKTEFASHGLFYYTDMGPGSAYKLHQVHLKYSISKSHGYYIETNQKWHLM